MSLTGRQLPAEISQLGCFHGKVSQVIDIAQGLSHYCYQVQCQDIKTGQVERYFVKYLGDHQHSAANERSSMQLASNAQISPKLIYSDGRWLVTEFIQGETLLSCSFTPADKLALGAKLLVRCHQITLNHTISSLSISEIIHRQLQQLHLTNDLHQILVSVIQRVTGFKEAGDKVLCHGDANFSNILVDSRGQGRLIDFECAFIGYREFDLAMLLAINQLPLQQLDKLTEIYQLSGSAVIDKPLVNHYLKACYLINGLWFYHYAVNHAERAEYHRLAKQQFQRFDRLECVPQQLISLLFA